MRERVDRQFQSVSCLMQALRCQLTSRIKPTLSIGTYNLGQAGTIPLPGWPRHQASEDTWTSTLHRIDVDADRNRAGGTCRHFPCR